MYALLAILAWSTVSTAFKLTLRALTPVGLLLISSWTALLFLFIINLISKGNKAFQGFFRNLTKSLLPGLLNPALYYMMLFYAYNVLRAQEAQVLNYTWAIVLSLLCLAVFKQTFYWTDLAALIISFAGVIIISTKGHPFQLRLDNPLGSIVAVSTSVVWAVYWVMNMYDKRLPEIKLLYNFMVGSIAIAIGISLRSLLDSQPLFVPGAVKLHGVLGGIYIGIFEMGLTFILWQKALQSSSNTSRIANLIFVTPFLSLVFLGPVLKERIHPATLIGLVMIILSNYLQHLKRKQPESL